LKGEEMKKLIFWLVRVMLVSFWAVNMVQSAVAGSVTGGDDTGGLVGDNNGTARNCYAAGSNWQR
jgi:hypothetical protein